MKQSEDQQTAVAEILLSLADRNTNNTNQNVSLINNASTLDDQYENCPASSPSNPTDNNSCEPPTKDISTQVLLIVGKMSMRLLNGMTGSCIAFKFHYAD